MAEMAIRGLDESVAQIEDKRLTSRCQFRAKSLKTESLPLRHARFGFFRTSIRPMRGPPSLPFRSCPCLLDFAAFFNSAVIWVPIFSHAYSPLPAVLDCRGIGRLLYYP